MKNGTQHIVILVVCLLVVGKTAADADASQCAQGYFSRKMSLLHFPYFKPIH